MEFAEIMNMVISFGIRVLLALVLFLIGRILINWCHKLVRRGMAKRAVDQGVCQFVDSALKVALYILLIFLIATNLGVESSSVAAILASSGIAIGLALQGSLSNLAGGMLILALKPFTVGDYIITQVGNNEGTVKEIKLFFTKLTTIDNKTIIIPNGALSNSSITNVTDRPQRQLDLRIHISHQTDLHNAKKKLEEILQETPEILSEEGVNVFIDELGNQSVIIGLRGWVKTEDYARVRCQILEEIKSQFDDEGMIIGAR